ncbi:MAG TPA: sugar ABC transporter substrate-binding protein [Ruminiclostridium sp.]
MKKIALVLVVIMLGTMFFGCSSGTPAQTTASTAVGDSKKPVEIICMVQSSPEAQFVKEIAKAYMAEPENKNVTVTINELGRDNVVPRIQNQLFTKSDGVDFFFITPALIGALGEGGVLEDLNPYFEKQELKDKGFAKSQFTKGGLDSGSYNGASYGLPFITSTMLLYYRTDLIKTPPQTWDEYYEVAKQFTQSVNPSSPTKYGTTVMGKPQQDGINLIEYSQIAWSMGGELVGPNDDIQVNSPSNIKALDLWSGLYKEHLVPPDATNFDYPAVLSAFQEEQVAMCIQWDAAAGTFADKTASPKISDKFAVSVLPGVKQQDGSILRTPYLNNWLACVNKFSTKKDQTLDFMAYLFNPKVFTKYLTPSMTTALNDVLSSAEFKKNKESSLSYEAYKQSLETGRGYVANKNLNNINSILDSALNKTMVGEVTSKQALDGAVDEIKNIGK